MCVSQNFNQLCSPEFGRRLDSKDFSLQALEWFGWRDQLYVGFVGRE